MRDYKILVILKLFNSMNTNGDFAASILKCSVDHLLSSLSVLFLIADDDLKFLPTKNKFLHEVYRPT